MKAIAKLAFNRVAAKKATSSVICAALLLTTIMFMTIVSISVNLISGYSLMMRMASGTDYHGYLRGAAFGLSGQELRDTALLSDDISEVAVSSNVAQYAMSEDEIHMSDNYIRAIERQEDLQHFYTDLVTGTFPANDTEILVNPIFFPNAKIGDTVGLYYISYYGDRAGTSYAEFTVSGIMKGRTDEQMSVVLCYSDTLEEVYGFSDQYLNVYFMFRNNRNLTGKFDTLINKTLASYTLPDIEVHGILNQAYLQSSIREALNPASVFLILFSASVVFFCSFLLIYNVYSISLTKDMQIFGLLHVIGTTYKQLRQMIILQSLILYAATLPFGLLAGYFIGWKMLAPLLFSSLSGEGLRFEFHFLIPLATALLTVFTLLWSATRPLHRLKALTPIAAVDYTPSADLSERFVIKKNHTQKNTTPNPARIAKYTVLRNRKKTLITALSMSLSVILFMLISTLCDYMISYTESNMQHADYIVKLNHTYSLQGASKETTIPYAADGGVGIDPTYCDAIKTSIYTDEVALIRTAVTTINTPQKARAALGTLRNTYLYFNHSPALKQAQIGQIDVLVVGIPDDLFRMIRINDLDCIGGGYESGYAIYDGAKMAGIRDTDGNPIGFSYFENGQSVRLGSTDYLILSSDTISPTDSITGWIDTFSHRAVLYLPEQAFLREFGEGQIYGMLVNAKEDCYDLLRSDLLSMEENFSVITDETIAAQYAAWTQQSGVSIIETLSFSAGINGRMDQFDQMRQTLLAIRTVGYSLASMIFLIGALNIVNASLSSVSERRREFAILEAVGMTDRQMRRMLLIESMYSGGASILMTVFFGFPLITLIAITAMDALVSPDWLSAIVMLAVCMAVSIFSALVLFTMTKTASVTERIRIE
ncbi:MAG: ABC transporter permease [Clostridia bacterium]|nr:ABC transporter permease [Clostridia bacterium]